MTRWGGDLLLADRGAFSPCVCVRDVCTRVHTTVKLLVLDGFETSHTQAPGLGCGQSLPVFVQHHSRGIGSSKRRLLLELTSPGGLIVPVKVMACWSSTGKGERRLIM